jgi:integrase
LNDELAAYLKDYIATTADSRRSPLLFQTDSGLPLAQSNIIRDSLKGLGVEGFHVFRRFRVSQLVEADCPEDLKKYWTGHATKDVTEIYGRQSTKVVKRRQEWAEKIGLGFTLNASQCIPVPVANAA